MLHKQHDKRISNRGGVDLSGLPGKVWTHPGNQLSKTEQQNQTGFNYLKKPLTSTKGNHGGID
jgi:hypothetical protein